MAKRGEKIRAARPEPVKRKIRKGRAAEKKKKFAENWFSVSKLGDLNDEERKSPGDDIAADPGEMRDWKKNTKSPGVSWRSSGVGKCQRRR